MLCNAQATLAEDADFITEFLSLKCAVRVVDSVDEAIRVINHGGSHHTDMIVGEDAATVAQFLNVRPH